MKGSVFVLVGCFALFAAPSHSNSVSEDDQLANRRDALSGDAVENADTPAVSGANPGNESVAGDARAEKSKIRKRDTRSFFDDDDEDVMENVVTTMPPLDKETALGLLKRLGNYTGICYEQFTTYLAENEVPNYFVEIWFPEAVFHQSHMISWLKIMKDSLSECVMSRVNQLISDFWWRNNVAPDSVRSQSEDTFANATEFFRPLIDIGRRLKKCLEDGIAYLEATWNVTGDTVQRSSESFPDLLMELIKTLSIINGKAVPVGGTVPMSPPSQTRAHYPDSVPVITTYKKRNSLDKPKGYRHYTNLPAPLFSQFVPTKDIRKSNVPRPSGFRGGAVQVQYAPGITTLPANILPTQQLSLLNVVLDNIYSKLKGKASSPVEGLRVDASGAPGLYPGNGQVIDPRPGGMAVIDPGFNPNCVHKGVE